MQTFTSVYYETSYKLAVNRLNHLRKVDFRYKEIKAYIKKEGKNNYRVLQKVEIPQSKRKL